MSQVDVANVVAVERIGSLMGTPRSFKILLNQMASHAATMGPLYSALVLDIAIIGYFLLLHDMAPLPREKTNLDVDLSMDSVPSIVGIGVADL